MSLDALAPELVEAPRGEVDGPLRAIEWLIDNKAAYNAVMLAVQRARTSVWISQLAFDADCEAYSAESTPANLLDVLIDATRARGLDVRVLLNASILVNTVKPLRAALERRGAPPMVVRGISRFPQLLHAKMLIVDGRDAFIMGSPFVNGYWDDHLHRPVDERRPVRELGGRPLHDLSVRVQGTAVDTLVGIFAEWWTDAADEAPRDGTEKMACCAPSEVDYVGATVTRTSPANVLSQHASGHVEILDSMLEGIGGARELLYVEHQYLSCRPVIRAIRDALDREPALEVIALVNQNPDITAYRGWQNARLEESGLRDHPRFGLFALWCQEQRGRRLLLNQVFVHSKVLIADDAWATVGSANIDGVSLHSYGDDFESRLGQAVFGGVRNFDVNLELRAVDDVAREAIVNLRLDLWREHLGVAATGRSASTPLDTWRDHAAANITALNAWTPRHAASLQRTLVLPYSRSPEPAMQLTSLGVRARSALDLQFRPGWLEVHCSPNWIRNMFA